MKRPLSPTRLLDNGRLCLPLATCVELQDAADRHAELQQEKKKLLFSLCEVCNIQLNSAAQAQVHYNGKSHLKRVKQLNNGELPQAGVANSPVSSSGSGLRQKRRPCGAADGGRKESIDDRRKALLSPLSRRSAEHRGPRGDGLGTADPPRVTHIQQGLVPPQAASGSSPIQGKKPIVLKAWSSARLVLSEPPVQRPRCRVLQTEVRAWQRWQGKQSSLWLRCRAPWQGSRHLIRRCRIGWGCLRFPPVRPAALTALPSGRLEGATPGSESSDANNKPQACAGNVSSFCLRTVAHLRLGGPETRAPAPEQQFRLMVIEGGQADPLRGLSDLRAEGTCQGHSSAVFNLPLRTERHQRGAPATPSSVRKAAQNCLGAEAELHKAPSSFIQKWLPGTELVQADGVLPGDRFSGYGGQHGLRPNTPLAADTDFQVMPRWRCLVLWPETSLPASRGLFRGRRRLV
ncbi:zinc finger protein 385B isoform X1 [Arapaima gigas]